MNATIKKWGNSAAVRIPAPVMEAAHLHLDEAVEIHEEAGLIVIEPVRKAVYQLADLLRGINAENLHSEVDFGAPQGKEAWQVARYVPDAGDMVALDFTPQAGHEQAGRRPALVLSPAAYNGKTGLMLCCPMTRQIKNYPFEVRITGTLPSVVLADQIKSLDWSSRNAECKGRVPAEVLAEVRAKVRALIGQDQNARTTTAPPRSIALAVEGQETLEELAIVLRVFSRERSAPGLRLAHGGGPSSDWTIFIGMSQHELELAYLRALNEYTHEVHKTHMISMSKDISGFTAHQAKEDTALQRYRAAQLAFISGPKEQVQVAKTGSRPLQPYISLQNLGCRG